MTNTTPETQVSSDPVNHPSHYTSHPSGIEAIQVTEHMGFNLGNAVKYIWRADLKNDANEDLKKAIWYIQRELERREKEAKKEASNTTGGSISDEGTLITGTEFNIAGITLKSDMDEEAVKSAINKIRNATYRFGGI